MCFEPSGLAFEPGGGLVVADNRSNLLLRLSPDGVVVWHKVSPLTHSVTGFNFTHPERGKSVASGSHQTRTLCWLCGLPVGPGYGRWAV